MKGWLLINTEAKYVCKEGDKAKTPNHRIHITDYRLKPLICLISSDLQTDAKTNEKENA